MTCFPNTRDVKSGDYYEGNLNDKNKRDLYNIDFAMNEVENILLDLKSIDVSELDIDQAYFLQKVVSDQAIAEKIMDFFKKRIESFRNEVVISMIESQTNEDGE